MCMEGREKVVYDGQRSECNTAFHFLLTGVSPEVLGSMGITHVKVSSHHEELRGSNPLKFL